MTNVGKSTHRDGVLTLAFLSLAGLLLFLVPPAANAANMPLLWKKCTSGSGAGECSIPRGIAIDPSSGNAYIADQANARMVELTAWGEFVKAWGWGVVASGPGNEPRNEIQEVTVDATGGSFSLSFGSEFEQVSPLIAYDASPATVQAALEETPYIAPGDAAVSGPAGGPWTIEFMGARADSDIPTLKAVKSSLTGNTHTATTTTVQNGGSFEVCVPANGDVCREGQGAFSNNVAGAEPGQLADPQGVALDSEGSVYVVALANHRVEKFDADGNFLLMFGGGVDQGPNHPGDVCTAQYLAEGDTCGAGETGSATGEFSANWPYSSYLAIGPDDTVYVGDQNRIQKFDAGGNYIGQIPLPEPGLVGSLAFDVHSGDLYFSYKTPNFSNQVTQRDVFKIDPNSGIVLGTLKVDVPSALATDAAGNVFVFQRDFFTGNEGSPLNHPPRVLEFNAAGVQTAVLFENAFDFSTGIAINSACGISGADVYVANATQANSFVSAYGPPPDPSICPPPEVAPSIEETYALSADTDGATVRAAINPHFWPDTRYFVQYGAGKCSEGGCDLQRPAEPGSLLTSQVLDEPINTANVLLGGLVPDTTYHYRFVATSGGGGPSIGPERSFHTFSPAAPPPASDPCPNAVFRTGPSARLPDCRAYEMVSPLDKNNGDVSAYEQNYLAQASVGGERMSFSSFRAFADAEAAPLSSQYLASRDPSRGWETQAITPPREDFSYYPIGAGEGIQYKAFSDDLCSGWILQDTGIALTPEAPPSVPNLYRRSFCDPSGYELLSSKAPPGFLGPSEEGNSRYYPMIQGFSADAAHSVFQADAALTPNANPKKGVYQVYETYDGGKLRLVSLLPNGSAATTNSSLGTALAGEGNFRSSNVFHAVSDDGARVFWSAGSKQALDVYAGETGALYVRLNATEAPSKIAAGECTEVAKACTVEISGSLDTVFQSANPQGTTAIYTAGSLSDKKGKLFEFDVESATSQLIAESVMGVVGISEDASRVYFVSSEVFSGEEENSEGDKAETGEPNLYLYEKGAGFTFIAALTTVEASAGSNFGGSSVNNLIPKVRTSRVSPSGLSVAFTSTESLTGYDNADAANGEVDAEVFLYDASANGGGGQLSCVSCNPSGARPVGREVVAGTNGRPGPRAAAIIPGWQTQTHPGEVLSANGNRLFFNSYDALLPRDTNGKADVYEWEAPGSGSCVESSSAYSPPNNGCLYLISSGESPEDSEFFDATPSGSDVYFATQSGLLPQDYGLLDVYDARVNGGFAPPPATPPACEGEACQGPLAPPDDPTPGSSSYQGPGNQKAELTKKAKKKAKSKKHKKRHAGKHAKKSRERAKAKGRAGR
jgi:hypothetical protein